MVVKLSLFFVFVCDKKIKGGYLANFPQKSKTFFLGVFFRKLLAFFYKILAILFTIILYFSLIYSNFIYIFIYLQVKYWEIYYTFPAKLGKKLANFCEKIFKKCRKSRRKKAESCVKNFLNANKSFR